MGEVLAAAFRWLNDPLNWQGPDGVVARTVEHLGMSAAAVAIAAAVALPLGVWLGHGRRGGSAVVFAAIFALPLVLTNTWAAVRGVDASVVEAARGMGMSTLRTLLVVELPLALPLMAAGLRTAAVQVVATVPLAGLVGGGGLGPIVITGLATRRFGEVVAGGILIALLALLVEAVLALAQRVLTPRSARSRTATAV